MCLAPKFIHDCEKCTFIGRLDGCDGYKCESTYVLRASDRPDDYRSMDMAMLPILPPTTPYHVLERMALD